MAVEGAYVCKESVEWVRKIMDPQCSAEERALCHRVSFSHARLH